jgi:hypothetical protein
MCFVVETLLQKQTFSFFFVSLPQEALPYTSTMMCYLATGLKANGPNDHGLKPLKPT